MTPDMNELMKQAQVMQQKMQDAQKELTNMIVIGEAGGGMVKIKMNGRHEAKKARIDENALKDKTMLEDLFVAAVNNATHKIEKASRDKLANLTEGMQLPEGFKLPGDNEAGDGDF